MKSRLLTIFLLIAILMPALAMPRAALAAPAPVFVNELHYDNAGADVGEAIEVAGPVGTNLAGWSIALYNGSSSQLKVYDTINLSGVIPDQDNGFGTLEFPRAGIQNGAPDGFALVDSSNTVLQFLSYEGTFTAVDGPANGMTSTDIGVSESSSTPVGNSLQLSGTGVVYEDFSWTPNAPNTFGSTNTGQSFSTVPTTSDPVINEFVANHTSVDTNEFVEVFGDSNTDYSAFTIVEIEGEGSGTGQIDDGTVNVGVSNANGFWTTGFQNNLWENGTMTLLLVEGFTGSVNQDLDTNNDGILDITPWTRVVDDVAVTDGGGSDLTYSSVVLGPFFDGNPFGAGGASRIPNGTDTDVIGDWVRNDFDGFGLPGFVGSPAVGEAVNTPGIVNEEITVPTDPFGGCGDGFETAIHTIQGKGLVSPDVGSIRTIEGVVVGDFEDTSTELSGFFLQEEDGDVDSDPATSEGIFVFNNGFGPGVDVSEVIRVRGTVTEFFGLTEINNVTDLEACEFTGTATEAAVTLPVASVDDWEFTEGMLVNLSQTLYASGNFTQGRFGEVDLSINNPLDNPTNVVAPGAPANALQDLNDRSRIQMDDGSTLQNPLPLPPYLGVDGTLRTGDTLQGLIGVVNFSFGNYQIEPTQQVDFTRVNNRPTVPDVGGSIVVGAFNVLNYFTTIDDSGSICGPDQDQGCRGADTADEFTRQRDKIISAITTMNADVLGLMELENAFDDTPIANLVDGLNAAVGAGTYAYIPTGAIGSDAIRDGFIYQPASVTPVGDFAILDSFVDSRFNDDKNRPVLAQTFDENATGARLTVAVNHLKSKGSDCDAEGDPDTGDGQGNCNLTRTAAAEALADWLQTDPTGSADHDFLITGDLTSYAMEDPIVALETSGYTDLMESFLGTGFNAGAYSFNFFSQSGYLDHALANATLATQVTGAAFWHINADEPSALDYNNFNQPGLFNPDPFRSSDHDPVLVGLSLAPEVTIMEIQDAGHISPYKDVFVTTSGVVTAVSFNTFYVQDPAGDGNVNTSDGMSVFMGSSCNGCPSVGDLVQLTDTVTENAFGSDLSTTQMSFPAITILSSGNSLPIPVVIGSSGRIAPAVDVITKDERPVNLQTETQDPSDFNPDNDGIDFYESLEGMLVTIEDPVAVSGTRTFNSFSSEMFTLTNNGAHIAPSDARTARGGINLQPDPNNDGDQNPERVQIQFDGNLFPGSVPAITVGDRLGDVTGVMGYSFGNFEVNALAGFSITPGGLGAETTSLSGEDKVVTVASYNVLNLSPLSSDDNQRATLADQIVNNLGAPDVVALQEIQDNNGTVDDGTTDASETLQALVNAISAAGGPSYEFFDVAPADGTSGGVPGGNIRNAYLYNPDRVKLVDFVSLTPDMLTELGVSDPDAFFGTRNPLLATFKFSGKEFTVINNHLSSRFGSSPVFGGPQPFVQAAEDAREAQTGTLNEVVDALLDGGRGDFDHASKSGRVIVLGDLNTMEFTDDLTEILPGTGAERVLTNLIDSLTDDNVYTFNFEGNSQVLDHFLVTDNLLGGAQFDIVHLNVDFPRVDNTVGSDHEPLLASFEIK